jgi:hypothetical protein
VLDEASRINFDNPRRLKHRELPGCPR